MSEMLTTPGSVLPATSAEALERIANVEKKMRQMPQIDLVTEHILHAGMYARTIHLERRVAIVSVLIKVPTMLTVNGICRVYAGDSWHDLSGFNVIPACAGRKMIYITESPTDITMVFPTRAKTIEEAEKQFTDDADMLLSRQCTKDVFTITGVEPCQE